MCLQQRKKDPSKITCGNFIKERDTDKIKFGKINLHYWYIFIIKNKTKWLYDISRS